MVPASIAANIQERVRDCDQLAIPSLLIDRVDHSNSGVAQDRNQDRTAEAYESVICIVATHGRESPV
jgi:hypothetical protein